MGKQVTHWTKDQKQEAAIHYAIYGSLAKIERDLGIPEATVGTWKRKDDVVWVATVAEVQGEKGEEHRAKYVQLVDAAQAKALELLPTTKSAKEAMLVACMGTDKVRLHDGLATSIIGKSETMESLARVFRKISEDWDKLKVVSVQKDSLVQDEIEEVE